MKSGFVGVFSVPRALGLALLLLLPLPGSAGAFDRETAEARIEVYVADREGRPVPGLGRDDFELYEGGEKVPITGFAVRQAAPEPGVVEEGPPALAVFVDRLYLTSATARSHAVAVLRELLGRPLGVERILFATYDGELRLRHLSLTDRTELDALLAELARESPRVAQRHGERINLLNDIEKFVLPREMVGSIVAPVNLSGLQRDGFEASLHRYADRRHEEVRAILSALDEVLAVLAGLPGRKSLVSLTGNLPEEPTESLLLAMETRYRSQINNPRMQIDRKRYDTSGDLQKLLARANAGGVTVYGLGVLDDMGMGSQNGRLLSGTLNDSQRALETRGLSELSRSTGGAFTFKAAEQGNLFDALGHDAATYYALEFRPNRAPGPARKLEVRLRRPDLAVRHREAVPARRNLELTRERTLAALLYGTTANPLGIKLEVGNENRTPAGEVEVEVTLSFPLASLTFRPGESFHEAQLRVYLGWVDGGGKSHDLTEIAVPIRLANTELLTALGQTAGYRTKLVLPAEPLQIAVGVRDELGTDDSTARVGFTPATAPPVPPVAQGKAAP